MPPAYIPYPATPTCPWHGNGQEGFCQAAESFGPWVEGKIEPNEVTGSWECRDLTVRTLHEPGTMYGDLQRYI